MSQTDTKLKRFTPFDGTGESVHVSIDQQLRQELDQEARRLKLTRSSLVRKFIAQGLAQAQQSA